MSVPSIIPDLSSLEVPIDAWSAPFWDGTAAHRLLMPRCTNCGAFRWPAGPFCPVCHSQPVYWVPAGPASIQSFTILPVRGEADTPPAFRVPVLAVFAAAPGVRLISVLVDAAVEGIVIGDPLVPHWLPALNATIPVFRLSASPEPRP